MQITAGSAISTWVCERKGSFDTSLNQIRVCNNTITLKGYKTLGNGFEVASFLLWNAIYGSSRHKFLLKVLQNHTLSLLRKYNKRTQSSGKRDFGFL